MPPSTKPAVVSALRPAVKGALHLLDDDLDHVYEMPAELVELGLSLARHAAFDLYITQHEEQA